MSQEPGRTAHPGAAAPWGRSWSHRLWQLLPASVDRRVVVAAWSTFVVQVAIVGTGGLVRLTASGLGCPTWPRCTAESFVNTPEMGIHGVIEFGNRLLTFVLVAVAIITFLLVVGMRRARPDLFWLALIIGLYVPIQAVIGGITVLTNLNPYVVGLHYFASVVLVGFATVFVARVYAAPGPRVLTAPRRVAVVAHTSSAAVLVTVLVGILVTGAGPHAGDAGAARNGLDPELMQHLHSWPAYLTLASTVVLLVLAWRLPLRPWVLLLIAVEGAQVIVGLWQARTGLPIVLVNMHMVLAVLLVAAMTAVIVHLKAPASPDTHSSERSSRAASAARA